MVVVAAQGRREPAELQRQHLGVREAEYSGADRLGERAAVDERAVVERREPVEVVIDRVVDAAAPFAPVAQVQRGAARMLQERRVIRPGGEGVDAQMHRLADLTTAIWRRPLG